MFIIKKVLIICGGRSSEHHISLKSTYSVVNHIDKNLFDYRIVIIDFHNNWYEYNDDIDKLVMYNVKNDKISKVNNIIDYIKNFDVVFPLIHGTNGEDGKLQGMLELFGIRYVGCDYLTSSILMDKDISKLLFKSLNIPQINSITLKKDDDIKSIIKQLQFPLIVKPSNGGSSIGINKANNKKELKKSIKEAFKYDKKIIVESYVEVRELEVAVLEDNDKFITSKTGEIKSANNFYDYNAKYLNDKSYTIIPKDLSDEVIRLINLYTSKIIKKLGIKGYARIDYFMDDNNKIYINEVNTIPGFTDISMYPKLMEDQGIIYTDLITKLINNA